MQYSYKVERNNVVDIYRHFNGTSERYISMPWWPDGTPWTDEAEASAWAEIFIEAEQDATLPFPPVGPGKERQAKPIK